ncbi:hypothetical protein WJX77_006500 [Trebouxia sp. C0004]
MARPEIELPSRKQLAGTLLKDDVVTIYNNFSQGMSKAKQAGEASKARRLLREWKPSLMTLDCYSHQFNLSVGDYLNSKKTNHMYLEIDLEHLGPLLIAVRTVESDQTRLDQVMKMLGYLHQHFSGVADAEVKRVMLAGLEMRALLMQQPCSI